LVTIDVVGRAAGGLAVVVRRWGCHRSHGMPAVGRRGRRGGTLEDRVIIIVIGGH
jgi:hypothetical protein